MQVANFLQQLELAPGESHRTDCPFCGHKHTFSISNIDGKYLWYCYYANCHSSGAINKSLSLDTLKAILHKKDYDKTCFDIPDYFIDAINNESCIKLLTRFNSIEAYSQDLVRVKYDPKQNRLAFIITDELKNPVDAVGRSFNDIKPKWLRYGNGRYPLVVGAIDLAVLVEDAFSACAVSHVATGIALLGTGVPDEYISIISNYSRIIIALDKDATTKAIALQKDLNLYAPTSVLLLEKDLKYYNKDAIKVVLRNA